MRDRDRTDDGTHLDSDGRFVIHPWDVRPDSHVELPEGVSPREWAIDFAMGTWGFDRHG
jgi:hypothetical protein